MNKKQRAVEKILNKTHVLRFIPRDMKYLTETKRIPSPSGNKNLKTDYLIDIINTFINNYHYKKHDDMSLSTQILRKNYGGYYKEYINYLEEVAFIELIRGYNTFAHLANKYGLIKKVSTGNCIRVECSDSIFLKKWKDFHLAAMEMTADGTEKLDPIRQSLIIDLFFVELDYNRASTYLNRWRSSGMLRRGQYLKNMMSIEAIHDESLFWSFDKAGRMHTNFTILKKHIRNNFIKINGESVSELDIPNAQPIFLALLLAENDFWDKEEFGRYIDAVRKKEFYEELMNIGKITRDEAKEYTYTVLFGKNGYNAENNLFRKVYPNIHKWMRSYKKAHGDHAVLSVKLQSIEADLMFNKIIKEIKEKYPDMILFTVHDSVYFQSSQKELVEPIFRKKLEEIWHSKFDLELHL